MCWRIIVNISEFNLNDAFKYENGFYLTSDTTRIGKLLAHYEIYKKIINIPGHIAEFGVFKGASLVRWATFRELLENENSRKIMGFDTFAEFPETDYKNDKSFRERFVQSAGLNSIELEDLKKSLASKNIGNYELVPGDILQTLPKFLNDNPHHRFSLVHIDTDVYEPAKVILELIYPKLVPGGIILFDDYGSFPGETQAADEFLSKHNHLRLQRESVSHLIPSYVIKPHM